MTLDLRAFTRVQWPHTTSLLLGTRDIVDLSPNDANIFHNALVTQEVLPDPLLNNIEHATMATLSKEINKIRNMRYISFLAQHVTDWKSRLSLTKSIEHARSFYGIGAWPSVAESMLFSMHILESLQSRHMLFLGDHDGRSLCLQCPREATITVLESSPISRAELKSLFQTCKDISLNVNIKWQCIETIQEDMKFDACFFPIDSLSTTIARLSEIWSHLHLGASILLSVPPQLAPALLALFDNGSLKPIRIWREVEYPFIPGGLTPGFAGDLWLLKKQEPHFETIALSEKYASKFLHTYWLCIENVLPSKLTPTNLQQIADAVGKRYQQAECFRLLHDTGKQLLWYGEDGVGITIHINTIQRSLSGVLPANMALAKAFIYSVLWMLGTPHTRIKQPRIFMALKEVAQQHVSV